VVTTAEILKLDDILQNHRRRKRREEAAAAIGFEVW